MLWCGPVSGQQASLRPRLVVVLLIDQFRSDYIRWYGRQWKSGLRRVLDRGAWFTNAAYPYMNTVTCSGHATVATGDLPAQHGIVLNQWYDRAAGRVVSCTADEQVKTLAHRGDERSGRSAARLLSTTLAEELRAQLGPESRTVTLSLKARSAIMLAGRGPGLALWFDNATASWATSTAFAPQLPSFVLEFIRNRPVEADFGKQWTRMLRAGAYKFEDNGPDERPPAGWTNSFPHALVGQADKPDARFYELWRQSPYSDEYLAQMAKVAVQALRLGSGSSTDFLGVSFSALDLTGHDFGPHSQEVQDVLVRLDATIGDLLVFLDSAVGRNHYLLALTTDHGVATIPETLARKGLSAGRVSISQLYAAAQSVLEAVLGPGHHVLRVEHTDLYLAPGVLEKLTAQPPALRAVIDALQAVPGVERVFHRDEMTALAGHGDPLGRAVSLSYHADRSGDLLMVPKANWILSADATTHGTARSYDAHVPLILMGAGIRPGKYAAAASPADIAPTLASLCGIRFEGRAGRLLTAALAARRTN